MLPDRVA